MSSKKFVQQIIDVYVVSVEWGNTASFTSELAGFICIVCSYQALNNE